MKYRKITALCLAVFLMLSSVMTGCGREGKSLAPLPETESDKPSAVSEAMSGEAAAASLEETLAGTGQTLTLTEAMARTGDLILVNSRLPYDFDANADSADIVNIRDTQSFFYQVSKRELSVASRIMPSLDAMIAACHEAMGNEEAGIESAYRSLDYQINVMSEITELYGEDYAAKYVAQPGYSEHHTGLSVDIGRFFPDGSEGSFSESESAVWMNDNSWRYGFVRRYAEDKTAVTGISNEAWHFRYVGVPHAAYMKANNLALEEYLELLRSETDRSHPLRITAEDGTYAVYMTTETTIPEPAGDYRISGSNSDEWIVTVRL